MRRSSVFAPPACSLEGEFALSTSTEKEGRRQGRASSPRPRLVLVRSLSVDLARLAARNAAWFDSKSSTRGRAWDHRRESHRLEPGATADAPPRLTLVVASPCPPHAESSWPWHRKQAGVGATACMHGAEPLLARPDSDRGSRNEKRGRGGDRGWKRPTWKGFGRGAMMHARSAGGGTRLRASTA